MIADYFPKTSTELAKTKLFIVYVCRSFKADVINIYKKIFIKIVDSIKQDISKENVIRGLNGNVYGQVATKPIVFASACVNKDIPGGWKYNGGIKELNGLVKLLCKNGYEAYMVTYDGSFEPWLIEHQHHISIEAFKRKISQAKNVRCVTSWAEANCFIDNCSNIYFWDMELAYTDNMHFKSLAKLYSTKISNTAAISRTTQSWHMAHFRKKCTVIPNICDDEIWFPIESERIDCVVGYMNEGDHTEEGIDYLKEYVRSRGLALEFLLIKGDEHEVLKLMRSCNIFVSMNIGKDDLWGEGCPRTLIEAMSVGCIPIAYDVIGNRETLISNFNGIIVPRYRLDKMAQVLAELYTSKSSIALMRSQSGDYFRACHNMNSRWEAVQQFLEL